MNNMFVVRGNKMAFHKFPGDWGQMDNDAFDMKALMTDYGLFIPTASHGVQVLPLMVRNHPIFHLPGAPKDYVYTSGLKGVVISPSTTGVDINQVRMTENTRKIALAPLIVGERGFAIMTAFSTNQEMMAMAIRLTDTLEESVDMYCRHMLGNRSQVLFWDAMEMRAWLKENWLPWVIKQTKSEADGLNKDVKVEFVDKT
jgi:hypothetical protein